MTPQELARRQAAQPALPHPRIVSAACCGSRATDGLSGCNARALEFHTLRDHDPQGSNCTCVLAARCRHAAGEAVVVPGQETRGAVLLSARRHPGLHARGLRFLRPRGPVRAARLRHPRRLARRLPHACGFPRPQRALDRPAGGPRGRSLPLVRRAAGTRERRRAARMRAALDVRDRQEGRGAARGLRRQSAAPRGRDLRRRARPAQLTATPRRRAPAGGAAYDCRLGGGTGMVVDILSYGIGSLAAFALLLWVAFIFIRDITQKKHAVLRSYPVVGHLRYFFEQLGENFRQYFFTGDREEMPFNRATRGWVYRLAKNEGGTLGFGSTYDLHEAGALIFVNHPFPVLEEERLPTPALVLGEGYCRSPFEARSIVNISGMSYGAISAPAVSSLSRGAAVAGCWLDTGEGGLAPYHLEGGCDVIMQIGTANYGLRDAQGELSPERLIEVSKVVKAFEIKLSQGAQPGKGGILPGRKVTPEIAQIRGIAPGRDSISPNRHRDISCMSELVEKIATVRGLTGRPVGADRKSVV